MTTRRVLVLNDSLPAGWTVPAGGGSSLETDFQFDNLGRVTRVLGPAHTVDLDGVATQVRTAAWTVYRDDLSQVWTAQGYALGDELNETFTLVNPVSISIFDEDGRLTDQVSAIRASTSGELSAGDSFPQSSYCRWTHHIYNDNGQLIATRVYFAIPASGSGSNGVNYDETGIAYDRLGRQNKAVSPGGTITRTVHDARGLPLSVYLVRNRWYGPLLGRWLIPDPLATGRDFAELILGAASEHNVALRLTAVYTDPGDEGSVFGSSLARNWYSYVSGNPLNGIDPAGLWELRCRRLAGAAYATFQRHCWVECNGKSYSLLNKDGTATPVINDPADKGKGDVVAKGKNECGCIAAQFTANKKTYAYDKDDCNSNYYASQLLKCCSIKVDRPSRAYGWGNCTRDKGKFKCKC